MCLWELAVNFFHFFFVLTFTRLACVFRQSRDSHGAFAATVSAVGWGYGAGGGERAVHCV